MAIRAPYCTVHTRLPAPGSYEREMFFETLGCCWALAAKNINGEFSIQLMSDLCRVNLQHGIPSHYLSKELFWTLIQTFSARCPSGRELTAIENNALCLLDLMSSSDFLNFHSGMYDTVEQLLKHDTLWTTLTDEVFLSLRYFSLGLLDVQNAPVQKKQAFAGLLAEFICAGRTERQFSMRYTGSNYR